MIMKKVRPHVVAILVVLAFAFTAIAFLAPFEHGFNFIVAYAAGMLAILLQIPVFKLAYPPETPLKSQVLGYPIHRVGILYMIIQTILSLVIFSIGDSAPPWSTLLLCILVLAGALVLGLTAKMAREAISNMETVKNADTRLMKSLALRAEALTTRTSDPMLAQEIKKLAADKTKIEDYLDLFQFWFRDVLLFKATTEIDNLVFKQEINYIRDQASERSYENLEKILEAIDKTKVRLSANVNPELALELLFLTFRER